MSHGCSKASACRLQITLSCTFLCHIVSLATQQLRAKPKSLTFPPLSIIARYSFIQLSKQGRQSRERKCPIFETVAKGDSNQGSIDCESGVLPLSYRATCPSYNACHFFLVLSRPLGSSHWPSMVLLSSAIFLSYDACPIL